MPLPLGTAVSTPIYTCNFEGIPSGCNVKFASSKAGKRFYLYNVNILDMSEAGSITTTYADLTTTSYTIKTLFEEMYYYRVQAVCDEGTSRWSEWMDVDVASEIRNMPENEIFKDNIFNLTGRRLPSIPQHGFYIRGGKTYMVR